MLSDKTLIVGPSWVGDMVMAQALFKAIKDRYPYTAIDVLAPQWSRSLTERMPEVSASIAMPLKHGEVKLKARYKLGKSLFGQYQRCYVLPNSFKSALIPFWAHIPKRIGWRGEWRYGLLNYMHILDKQKMPLMVQRYVALAYEKKQLLPPMGFRPSLVVRQEGVKAALLRYQLSTSKPIMILCPGAEFGPSKRWPEDHYAALARHYLDKGWQVWIFGSAKDATTANTIQTKTKMECVDLTGRTTLGEAIDLMSLAKTVVTNDSGLMHIAAALNRPLVAIYGSTDPRFTPPLSEKVVVVKEKMACSPCFKRSCPLQHHECMQKLSVEKIIEAVDTVTVDNFLRNVQ